MSALIAIGVALDCFIGLGFLAIWRRKRRERKEVIELARRSTAAVEASAQVAQEITKTAKRVGDHTQKMAVAMKDMSGAVRGASVAMSAFSHVLTNLPYPMSSHAVPMWAIDRPPEFCGRTDLPQHTPHTWAKLPDGSYGDYDDPGRVMVWCPGTGVMGATGPVKG